MDQKEIKMFYTLPITKQFDELFDEFTTKSFNVQDNNPPYNVATITKDEKSMGLIEIAATGLNENDIKVYFDDEGKLVIEGKHPKPAENVDIQYHYKGLSTKDFTRKFKLEKNFVVDSVVLKNGLLRIFLKEEKPDVQYLKIETEEPKNLLVS